MVSCNSSRLVTNCYWSRIERYILWVSSCLVACFSNQNLCKKEREGGMKVVCYQLNFEFQTYSSCSSQTIGYFHESKGKVHYIVCLYWWCCVVGCGGFFSLFFRAPTWISSAFFLIPLNWCQLCWSPVKIIRYVYNNGNLTILYFRIQQE